MSDRELKLYDTMTRKVTPIKTIEEKHLKIYSCGPTVYSYAHIGNFRAFIATDLIVRTAQALGWKVTYVSNITDVGHLTQDDVSDAAGEDKLAKALKSKEGECFNNVWELAEYYSQALIDDWERLNLLPPTVRPKATQHMKEQIEAIETLIEKGAAYETESGVYFSVECNKDYGKLSGNIDQEQLQRGVREVVQDSNKKHPADFALWKKDDKHLMQWYSPWGWGFPGWHLECSVMGMAYLGETFDIHGGGEDLIFPHHECEIAQSECLTGKKFVNYWVHTRFLMVEGEKMSKSKGNFYTVRDIIEGKKVHPLALRYALMTCPYNKQLNFTLQSLKDATSAIERFDECAKILDQAIENQNPGEDKFKKIFDAIYDDALDAMCNDLNTSIALAKAYETTKIILKEKESISKASAESAKAVMCKLNELLGVLGHQNDQELCTVSTVDEAQIQNLIEQRNQARKDKDFAKSDQIRDQLLADGIELRDTPEGTTWKIVSII